MYEIYEVNKFINPNSLIGYHNTFEPCIKTNKTYKQIIWGKPNGLWFTPNDEWKEYCEENELSDWVGQNDFKLKINSTNFLIIETVNELIEFNKKFGIVDEYRMNVINWKHVSNQYDGIFINNYNDIMKNIDYIKHMWLCHWDVNSGCVWNLKTIQQIEIMIDNKAVLSS